MTLRYCVERKFVTTHVLASLPPEGRPCDLRHSRFGLEWYSFPSSVAGRVFDMLPRQYMARWESGDAGRTDIYYTQIGLADCESDVDTRLVLGRWSPYASAIEHFVRSEILPFCGRRGVIVEALDEGRIVTNPYETGAFRICIHMGRGTATCSAGDRFDAPTVRALYGFDMPDLESWHLPYILDRTLSRDGVPVASFVDRHTVLVLPDPMTLRGREQSPMELLRHILWDVGMELRQARSQSSNGQVPVGPSGELTVKIDNRMVDRTEIVDVPVGTNVGSILVTRLGFPDCLPSKITARVGGRWVPMSYEPKDGETIALHS